MFPTAAVPLDRAGGRPAISVRRIRGRSPALRLLRAFGRLTEAGPARAGRACGRRGPVTRPEAAEQLRTLATVAVRDLAVPAVIRPHRDGWLIFMRGGHAWYGTVEAPVDALLAGEHRGGMPAGLS